MNWLEANVTKIPFFFLKDSFADGWDRGQKSGHDSISSYRGQNLFSDHQPENVEAARSKRNSWNSENRKRQRSVPRPTEDRVSLRMKSPAASLSAIHEKLTNFWKLSPRKENTPQWEIGTVVWTLALKDWDGGLDAGFFCRSPDRVSTWSWSYASSKVQISSGHICPQEDFALVFTLNGFDSH